MSELGQRMSAKEENLWIADYQIEPWGEERADLRAATVVKSNLLPWTKKTIQLKDCILNFKPPEKESWQDMKKKLEKFTRAMGGKVQ